MSFLRIILLALVCLLAGLFFLISGLKALLTGVLTGKSTQLTRSKHPGAFWLIAGLRVCSGLALTSFSAWALIYVYLHH